MRAFNPRSLAHVLPLGAAILLAVALAAPARASGPPATSAAGERAPQEEAERRGPTDATEVEAFLDGLMTAQMKAENVAGATVAVVRAGEVILAKGYGFANVEERTPVDPAFTLFRIGSVTKLFTWTAVM